jgi:VCBS repeat-containing protein
VTITVNTVNDAPVARGDSYTVNEDTTLTVATPGVLANDSDVEGSTLTVQLGASPVHGTVTLNSNGSFTYRPAANFNGTDSFTYRAFDGSLWSPIVTVTIKVSPVDETLFLYLPYVRR